MRVNLALQRIQLRIPAGDFLFIKLIYQDVQFIRHPVKGLGKPSDFVIALNINLPAEIFLFNQGNLSCQIFYSSCKIAGNKKNQYEGQYKADPCYEQDPAGRQLCFPQDIIQRHNGHGFPPLIHLIENDQRTFPPHIHHQSSIGILHGDFNLQHLPQPFRDQAFILRGKNASLFIYHKNTFPF